MSAIDEIAASEPFDVDTAPGETFALSPRVLSLWFWQGLSLIVLPALAAAVLGLLLWKPWLIAAVCALALLGLFALVRYNRAAYARFRCVLTHDGLLIRRGVVFRSEVFVPRARIQHTDVSEGPIARHYGIATIKVFTAGAQVGQLGIEGLPREAALTLRDRLLGRQGHDAV